MSTPPAATSTGLVDRIRLARAAERSAALEQVELAIEWARLHPCAEGEQAAHWGDRDLYDECTLLIAGEGAPTVGEFAPAELAAALDTSFDSAQRLLGESLELHHRLPGLMVHVRSGKVPVWLARRIAALTTDLSPEAVAFADRLISATPARINQVRAEKLVHEARLYF